MFFTVYKHNMIQIDFIFLTDFTLTILTVIKILLNVSAVIFETEVGLTGLSHWPVFGATLTPVL